MWAQVGEAGGGSTRDEGGRMTRTDDRRTRVARATDWAATRLGPHGALILLLVIGLLIVLGLTAVLAQVYDNITDDDGVAGLDQPLLQFAMTLRSPVADSVITGYTEIAGPIGMPILAVLALLVLGIRRRSWTPPIVIAAAGLGSLAMTIAGKDVIGRVRPPLADAVPPYEYSPSFPSGHTLNATVVAGAVAYLLVVNQTRRSLKALTIGIAATFAVTIGLSRVFLGHHWFTDVLGGWILGLAWLTVVIMVHRLFVMLQARRRLRIKEGALPPDAPA